MKVLVTDGEITEFPYSFVKLKRDNPNTSFPRRTAAIQEGYGIFDVVMQSDPIYDPAIQKVKVAETPIFIDEKWTLQKTVAPLEQPEIDSKWDAKKQKIREQVSEIRDSFLSDSIPYTFPGDTEPDAIQCRDDRDRQNIQDLVIDAMLKDPADTLYFMPKSNIKKNMTASEVIDMWQYLKTKWDQIVAHSWELKEQVAQAKNSTDLNNIDIKTGWETTVIISIK